MMRDAEPGGYGLAIRIPHNPECEDRRALQAETVMKAIGNGMN